MSWDEGKPMPSDVEGKKAEVRKMLGSKPSPGAATEAQEEPIPGVFAHARIEPAENGYALHIERKQQSSKSVGAENLTDMGTGGPPHESHKEYKTVHMHPQHLMTELNRHLVKGQVGSNSADK